ncbi:MAG: relaxase/mobilization nuclease domain-containing protein [Acidobacteria bacterium]|nr:relaxase/mobilization nuclease domain-containing protein [Acidobacteriota bacterium]
MHVKFIARGAGSASAAINYLLGERDAMGRERDGVEVLRGDPDMVAAVADSLEFEHKYRSIVIAWAPEARPTDAQINAVLDEFERTAWAGLEPDRYSWTAVLHREHGGGVHVHVLTARGDLETGKSLNIAPPGWQKTFDPLRGAFDHEHGWSRPDDPGELIRDYLVQRVEHGVVQSHADVVSALEDTGFEVPRQDRDYVTARDPESGKRWRLKGPVASRRRLPASLGGSGKMKRDPMAI